MEPGLYPEANYSLVGTNGSCPEDDKLENNGYGEVHGYPFLILFNLGAYKRGHA